MRILLGAFLAALPALSPAAADDYGERLCAKYMPPGTPCACVAPILEEEFDEEELDPLMQFLRSFMAGLKGDDATAQQTIDRIAAEYGKETIMDWLKRFEGLSPETAKTCNFKF
jgi:hypothetical protein